MVVIIPKKQKLNKTARIGKGLSINYTGYIIKVYIGKTATSFREVSRG